ncbi:MAG: S-layer homology domain-containing protein [Firmicutes bacterium]|nr:S-layer homology domain-containing protein [Bacillota bacterium]
MRKTISFLLLAAFLFSINGLAFADTSLKRGYSDVDGHWASSDIYTVAESGLMNGYPDNSFKPDKNVSRLELAITLDRTFDFNFSAVTFIKQPELKDMFDDVKDGRWYSNSLLETTFFGVLNTDNRMFKPNQDITRIQVAKAIKQSFDAKQLGVTMTQMFPIHDDTQELASDKSSALNFVFNTGIMKGLDNNIFAPNKPITRAELATVLKRTLSTLKVAEPIMIDNTEDFPMTDDVREIENPPLPKDKDNELIIQDPDTPVSNELERE